MTRIVLCCVVAFAAAARAEDLPIPPRPPANLALSEVAPVPDPDIRGPTASGSSETSLNVKFYRAEVHDPSLGFTPGSRYQSAEDRKPIQTPGLSVSVPIQ